MGACIDFAKVDSKENIRDAFREVKEENTMEYGNDPYNGTLSTCSLVRIRLNDNPYSKKREKEILSEINEDNLGKGEAYGYSLGIVGYELVTVKYDTLNNKAAFKKQFIVSYRKPNEYGNFKEVIFSDKNKAKQFAMKCAMDGFVNVSIDNKYVLESGDSKIGRVHKEVKIVKTPPKTLKDNQKCYPLYRYYFVGLASM